LAEGPIVLGARLEHHAFMPASAFVAIVDDEEPIRRALMRLLRSAGHASHAFASGQQFLDSLSAGPLPGCVVLDVHLAEMSGVDVARRLAQAWPAVRVIFITGHPSPDMEHQVLATRPSAYLLKPVNDRALLGAIAEALAAAAP
jgi:FixJ family two-component response regulator